MKAEAGLYAGITAFFVVIGLLYWFTSYEHAGSVMLAASALLGLMTAGYLWSRGRGLPPRPEDRADADPADGVGVVGRFPTPTPWPVAMAFGATMAGTGLAIGWWLVLGGAVIFGYAAVRLVGQSWAADTVAAPPPASAGTAGQDGDDSGSAVPGPTSSSS